MTITTVEQLWRDLERRGFTAFADYARDQASPLPRTVTDGCCPNCGSDRLILGATAARCIDCTARLEVAP